MSDWAIWVAALRAIFKRQRIGVSNPICTQRHSILRPSHRQSRDHSRKARCFLQDLALRCVRLSLICTLVHAQAEPTHRLSPKPVRVRVSRGLKQIEPPRRRPWWGAGRCKVTTNHRIGGRCWMTTPTIQADITCQTKSRPLPLIGVHRRLNRVMGSSHTSPSAVASAPPAFAAGARGASRVPRCASGHRAP